MQRDLHRVTGGASPGRRQLHPLPTSDKLPRVVVARLKRGNTSLGTSPPPHPSWKGGNNICARASLSSPTNSCLPNRGDPAGPHFARHCPLSPRLLIGESGSVPATRPDSTRVRLKATPVRFSGVESLHASRSRVKCASPHSL